MSTKRATDGAFNSQHIDRVADSLLAIEAEMRRSGVWSAEAPSAEALLSTQPFCIDTLEMTEWIQFIFLPKMKRLIENEGPLPAVSGMAPMAEEYFRGRPEDGRGLIRALARMDELLSNSAP
ncbi:YqcC family protein [Marinobacter salicampi]|uniref:YqcC family protein n=1 Tax=Marinobacter salicampi TaxID=435907 RepID=UPI00140B1B98|nr:YqcC family protein [Marinobacter salicampi]